MAHIYHRFESDTQTSEDAKLQQKSSELWGKPSRFSSIPKVKAYCGPLPEGRNGIEFETDVLPDRGSPANDAFWSGERDGVRIEDDFARIKIKMTKVRY